MTDLFGELRSLLAATSPSADLFAQICALLGEEPAPPPVLEYVMGHLGTWPPGIDRWVPWSWRSRLAAGMECPQVSLCDSLMWARAPEEPAVEPRALGRLLQSPALLNLRQLDLGRARVGPRGSALLARSPHVSKLEVLSLDSTSALARGLLELRTSPKLPSWHTLYVSAEGSLERTRRRMETRSDVKIERYQPAASSLFWQVETLLRADLRALLAPHRVRVLARYGGALAARRPGFHQMHFLPRVRERLDALGAQGAQALEEVHALGGPQRWQTRDAESLMFRALELSEELPLASDLGWVLEAADVRDPATALVVSKLLEVMGRPFSATQRRRLERLLPLLQLKEARALFAAWGDEDLSARLELHLATD